MLIQGFSIRSIAVRASGAAETTDEYFNLVTLLLPGNGTNGAQNNTFLDSSTNAFSITRNGNPTQGTFSPFSQTGWSGYFDGTGDTLSIPYNAALTFGAGDFTVECYCYASAVTQRMIAGIWSGVDPNAQSWFLYLDATGKVGFVADPNDTTIFTSNTAVQTNTWTHIAVTRSGNTWRLFINGALDVSATNSITLNAGNAPVLIGAYANLVGGDAAFIGYINNFRIVKGTAVYTSAFTPPTAPLTAISGTSLLTCQSNRFIDNSTNAFSITAAGNTSVQAFSPFDPTAAYSTSTVGGSGYFDGSGDYLSLASNSQTAVASNAFTLECYVYFASPAANLNQPLYTNYTTFSTAGSIYVGKHTNYSGRMTVWISNYSTAGPLLLESTVPPAGWTHYALVRSGNTFTLYRNGAVSVSATFAGATTGATNASYIAGGIEAGGVLLEGYLSSFRIVNGTAVYTSAFTPPTAPVTAISNTALLLNYTNAGITDAAAKNVLETAGGAAISTAQSKFGGSSMAFDGSGDYVIEPTSLNYGYGTGDFTIEFWLYLNSTGLQTIISQLSSNPQVKPHIYYSSGVRLYVNGADVITGGALTVSTWNHIAVSKSGSSTKLFINGTQSGSTYTDTNNYGTTSPLIIADYGFPTPTGTNQLNGYIDDLRITRGYARYTANFTPPTQAFPTQ